MKWTWPEGVTPDKADQVAAIAWVVYEDGPFEAEDGRATRLLVDALTRRRRTMDQQTVNKVLIEMEDTDARFGCLVQREQSLSRKRTYKIEAASNPKRDPFPPNPFLGEDMDLDVIEDEHEDEVPEIPVVQATPVPNVPSTDLAVTGQDFAGVSPTDKLLYVSSMIHEVVADLAHRAAMDHAQQVGRILTEQLTAANNLINEVERLRNENVGLRQAYADLERAYASLRATSNGRVTL